MDRRLSPTAVRRVATPRFFPDDVIARFGADSDAAIVMRSTTLAADLALDGVLVGTVDGEALPANSLIVSVASTTGDFALYVGRAGAANSNMVFQVDNSLGRVLVNPIAGDWDFFVETDNNLNGLVVDAGQDAISFGGANVDGAALIFNNTVTRTSITSVGQQVHMPAQTSSFDNGAVTVAIVPSWFLGIPTWNNTGGTLTATQAATLYIQGVPTSGDATVSFTNTALALWVDDGASRFDGAITTGETTIALLNTVATTVNFAGAATTINMGAAAGSTVLGSSNDAVTPTLAFGDGDTGFFEAGDDLLSISILASERWRISTVGIISQVTDGPQLTSDNATATIPTLIPARSDTNTGIGWVSADILSFITAGLERVRIGTGVVVGSPTGGQKGAGTINATAVYDDDVLLTDYVFEPTYSMMPVLEMGRFFAKHKHLPTIPGRDTWERKGSFSLGKVATHLWETVEVHARYMVEAEQVAQNKWAELESLKARVAVLETEQAGR